MPAAQLSVSVHETPAPDPNLPAGQASHAVDVPSMKYCSGAPPQHTLAEELVQRLKVPATEQVPVQSAQSAAAVRPVVAVNLPAAHRAHAVCPVAEEKVPATQATHTVMPEPDEYWPAEQPVHKLEELRLTPVEYLPAEQVSQKVLAPSAE